MSKLPTDSRPIKVAPELEEPIIEILSRYKGAKRELADDAVRKFVASSYTGMFSDIVAEMEKAVQEAVQA